MQLKARIGLSGAFTNIEALAGDGSVRRRIKGPKNLITDIGLQRLGGRTGPIYSFCRVGTGNSVPQPSDRQLDNQIGSAGSGVATATEGTNLAEGYKWLRITWTFPLGAVVGNVSEIGTGWTASGETLFSRALVKDEAGNPTAITVLEDEQLRVTWEHRRYWNSEIESGVVANEGNKGGTYSWQILPRNPADWEFGTNSANRVGGGGINSLQDYGSTIKSTTTAVSGVTALGALDEDLIGGSPVSPAGSAAGTFSGVEMTIRFAFTVSQGLNSAGINGFNFGVTKTSGSSGRAFFFQYKALIDPIIFKTDEDFLELDFVVSWGRHESA